LSDEKVAQQKDQKGPEEGPTPEAVLAQEKRLNEELAMKLKYLQADFENYRKRADKEKMEVRESSVRNLVLGLLSVVDELALAIENSRREGNTALLEGIKMVHKKLVASLEAEGLERIKAVGEVFDPRLHEAVEKVEGSSNGDVVVGEIRPGYTFRGHVIRPSMVKVELAAMRPKVEGGKKDE
jgi:molecular chaperone GrpE